MDSEFAVSSQTNSGDSAPNCFKRRPAISNFGAGNWPHSHRNSVTCAPGFTLSRRAMRFPQSNGPGAAEGRIAVTVRPIACASAGRRAPPLKAIGRTVSGIRQGQPPSSPRPVSGPVIEGKSRACGPADGTNLCWVWARHTPCHGFLPGLAHGALLLKGREGQEGHGLGTPPAMNTAVHDRHRPPALPNAGDHPVP